MKNSLYTERSTIRLLVIYGKLARFDGVSPTIGWATVCSISTERSSTLKSNLFGSLASWFLSLRPAVGQVLGS